MTAGPLDYVCQHSRRARLAGQHTARLVEYTLGALDAMEDAQADGRAGLLRAMADPQRRDGVRRYVRDQVAGEFRAHADQVGMSPVLVFILLKIVLPIVVQLLITWWQKRHAEAQRIADNAPTTCPDCGTALVDDHHRAALVCPCCLWHCPRYPKPAPSPPPPPRNQHP